MKEPTIYEFTDYFGDTRDVFMVRGEYGGGGLRVMFVVRRGALWEEWFTLTTPVNGLDGKQACIDSVNMSNNEICKFLERNGLAKPTGKSITEVGIFGIMVKRPIYEFTDKFFDEAFVLADD